MKYEICEHCDGKGVYEIGGYDIISDPPDLQFCEYCDNGYIEVDECEDED